MATAVYAVPQAAELLVIPSGTQAETTRKLLAAYLTNPFLDDDSVALARRAAITPEEAEAGLAVLCRQGFLRPVEGRGHALCLHDPRPKSLALTAASDGNECEWGQDLPEEGIGGGGDGGGLSPGAALGRPARADTARQCRLSGVDGGSGAATGVILLDSWGAAQLVDPQAAAWLGVEADRVDGACLRERTGVDPGWVLDGAPRLCFALSEPQQLILTLHACALGSASGVLVVLQDAAPQAQMSLDQAHLQEELFEQLRAQVAAPAAQIQRFLENPDADGFAQARAALEQVNAFLDDYFLKKPSHFAGQEIDFG